jgi:hypothetical protein
MDNKQELTELIEQINYGLSLRFKEKWRHRFSEHFIQIFQDKMFQSWKNQRPLKLSALMTVYRKNRYSDAEVHEFLRLISIEDYFPVVNLDKKFMEMRKSQQN